MKTIKSISKVKPDPTYYQRKIDRWRDRRDSLFAVAEAHEAKTGVVDKVSRREIDSLCDKIIWAMRAYSAAIRLREEVRIQEGRDPFTGLPNR